MPTLTWLTRESDLLLSQKAPYRLLEHAPELSFGDPDTGNMLIQGDNLEGLKALLPYFAGRVKCISIDPPYNTRSAFEHYDDNLEHTQWLSLMYPRLELLRELLSEDGSIWVSIDDNEAHYLKVVMDEVFGRNNFIANVVWQKKFSPQNDAKWLSNMHDHVLLYAKNKTLWHPFKLVVSDDKKSKRLIHDGDSRGAWISVDYTCNKNKNERPNLYYSITNPNTGDKIWPKETAVWRFAQTRHLENEKNNLIYWGKNGSNKVPRYKNFTAQNIDVQVPSTIWFHQDVGNTQEARKESLSADDSDPFATPKPERLLKRIFEIATLPGELVLDSFLGSGTTCAVAHKMGRQYIGIEMGEHAVTHCVPRLQKVIEGGQGGISETVNWKGGGGFRFYRLGASVFDESGKINEKIRFGTLAAHVWFCETKTPLTKKAKSPLLGIHDGTAYYLLFNGILGDKRPDGGNVLTGRVLQDIPAFDGPKVIYGETSRLGAERLRTGKITFKQIPYDIKAR